MHIRPFLLISIFIGAAAILPIHTYAQDNKAHDHASEKSAIHTEEVDKGKRTEHPVPDSIKHEDQVSQVKNPGPPKDMPEKAKAVIKVRRPEKAEPPGVHRRAEAQKDQSVKSAATDKGTAETRDVKEADSNGQTVPKESAKPLTVDIPKAKHSSPKLSYAVSKAVEEEVESQPVKKNPVPTLDQKPVEKPVDQPTPKKQRLDIEVIHTSPHRHHPSGGENQESPGTGSGATSFVANGVDWETGLYLGNIYHAREDRHWYQWMNAPPSPPPEKAPFLTVSS
ncbi:hypothetical protein CN378_17470 [Bacillus sp. AFS015802]|uniref:hypothetical protein n=1 Tax=Bacillus sp. AFS015802 TaxID=2033486 RepID=UPI000BF39309|nr:hypothetical protein [Bacillus sp. AFS015802]PFA62833.1 hypothetical protein CN378_17470 [Bacillus sp. AFS015802]